MLSIKRGGSLIRCFYSVHQSCTLETLSVLVWPKRVDSFRLSSSSAKQGNHADTSHVDQDRHIKLIKLEIALIRERGRMVPDVLKKKHWDELLVLQTKAARRKYLSKLVWIEQKEKDKSLMKKQLQKEEREKRLLQEPPQEERHTSYSLKKGTFFLRIGKATMNSWRNNRLHRAMQFGQKLIFDCSYDEYMTRSDAKYTADLLRQSFVDNRNDKDPFDMHFCNANFNSGTLQQLELSMPNVRNKAFPMNLHEGSFLDLFPKDQLVYLTPHCRNDLTEYDPSMIYIIGAFMDKTYGDKRTLSLGKAKELNLKMARLPLERYPEWSAGFRKSLSLDQMVRIMLDLKRTGKWEVALRHVRGRNGAFHRGLEL